MADIFLSYAEEDREAARRVAGLLEASGWSVWWDRRIPAGKTWRDIIEEAIAGMRCMVVLWSRHSVESDWVSEEAEEGRARKVLVPVLLEQVMPPLGLRSIQAADLSGWDGSADAPGARQLVADLAALLGQPLPSGGVILPPAKVAPRLHPAWLVSAALALLLAAGLAMVTLWREAPPVGGSRAVVTTTTPEAVKPPAAVALAPEPAPLVPFDEAVQAATLSLFDQARLAPGTPERPVLAIDPIIDGVTGEQTVATQAMAQRIAALVQQRYPSYQLQPFSADAVAGAPIVLIGTLTAADSERKGYRLCLSLADLRAKLVVGKSSARAGAAGVDPTPGPYFQDSPTWLMEAHTEGYIKTCQEGSAGEPIRPAYLEGVRAAALVAEAIAAYDSKRLSEALALYKKAEEMRAGNRLQIQNGLYLVNTKLGRRDAAVQAFGNVVDLALAQRRLAVKFLFQPGSTAFVADPAVSGDYPMWLRQIAHRAANTGACLEVSGHTSRTGPEPLNQRLSLRRAEAIRRQLIELAPGLESRSIAAGAGSRENLVGTRRDDSSDALDRRVVFKVVECGGRG
ncbi:MAG: TIR domain-containing protein [Noviherbaspirillum sp.]